MNLLLSDDEWTRWTNAEIARRCHVDSRTVDKYRTESDRALPETGSEKAARTYTNKNGQTATMYTENIGKPGRNQPVESRNPPETVAR